MLDIVNRLLQFDGDGYTRFRGLTISEEAAAEITQLRAELAAERELADRLANDAKNLIQWFNANLGGNKGELDDIQESLLAHATRRNK